MASPRRIDVHFHLIPPFYSEAVYAAGRGPAIGSYPDWTPELALELMDAHGIEVALTSLAQPGVGFGTPASAQALARRCNDYAAELVARWPKRFGAFGTVPMWDADGAIDEVTRSLDVLKHDGVSLFASYGEQFLGDPFFDPLLDVLDARGAVVLRPSRPASVEQGARAAVAGIHDGVSVRHHAGGGEPHFLRRDRAFSAHPFHPAACRRAGAVLCLAAVGVADDRQAAAAALARAGALRAAAFLVRQRALAGRGDFRRARSGGAARAHRVRHRLSVRQSAR